MLGGLLGVLPYIILLVLGSTLFDLNLLHSIHHILILYWPHTASIFLVLGNHGFVGLALFLALWIVTWKSAAWIRREGTKQPETKWCSDLGAMCQVSLVGYAVGGAFLSLSYFDLPYNIMVLVVLTRKWIAEKLGKTNQNHSKMHNLSQRKIFGQE
ncbi:MAG: hypothetical protein IPJ49_29460 [Candidatus Obscuribacter sp.]|nr:hypothetical protein [Candidatus Obscuribacter sp.]